MRSRILSLLFVSLNCFWSLAQERPDDAVATAEALRSQLEVQKARVGEQATLSEEDSKEYEEIFARIETLVSEAERSASTIAGLRELMAEAPARIDALAEELEKVKDETSDPGMEDDLPSSLEGFESRRTKGGSMI